MNLSEEIKRVRLQAFLTQAAFAEKNGVSFSAVNRWENGKGRPNLTAMKKIRDFCKTHEISYTELEAAWLDSSSNENRYRKTEEL